MMRRCQNSRYEEGYKMQKVLIALLLIGMSFTAHAQRDKSRTWEWSIAGLYQDSKNMGSESGSSLQVDNALGIGFNVGYNWTDHFTLGFDFDFMQPDYRAVLVDDTVQPAVTTEINHELSQFNGRLKATYNFLEGPFGHLSKQAWGGVISTPMSPMAIRLSAAGGIPTGATFVTASMTLSMTQYSATVPGSD
jgi:opacity protein-like surface antigen